jgi:phospholipase C
MTQDRRSFLKTAAGASALALLPPNLRAALAEPFPRRTGTIADVEHVVIFMQENRSFDHYFGTLKGVRGFSDPRAIALPSGKPVWYQPKDGEEFTPFHLDSRTTSAQCLASLDHSWKGAYDVWKNYDAWIPTKTKMTMGYFDRRDIAFFHALADSFTICDAYHCSVFGPTNPNRLHLFSGTSGLTAGYDGIDCVANPGDEDNETADIRNDSKKFKPFEWATYAEALEAAGVDWRVYQEYDNFGDNGLAYFKDFRAPVHHPKLVERGRSWVKGSNKENAKTSRGEHLVSAFAEDVALGRLPKVSWIVAPTIMSEHPQAPPGFGESLVSRLLDALAANRKVWSKTAFLLNYDENDGFFDHMPPAIPPLTSDIGASTVGMAGEDYHGVPFGFGPRVPMLVISPWSVGGFVNSQLFDHTSVLRFLETRFGVAAPNISAWRRAVAGDLTSAFDFSQEAPPALPEAGDSMKRAEKQCKLPAPNYAHEDLPRQESGGKAARPLPYALDFGGGTIANGFAIALANNGRAGAALRIAAADAKTGPWFFTVEAGKTLTYTLPRNGAYDFSLLGPNGFFRRFAGGDNDKVQASFSAGQFSVANASAAAVTLRNGYDKDWSMTVAPGNATVVTIDLAKTANWYDVSAEGQGFVRQFAGHIENGAASRSDPLLG